MKRRFVFTMITVLISLLIMELGSWGFAAVFTGGLKQIKQDRWKTYNRGDILAESKNADNEDAMKRAFGARWGSEIVHPYLGYVFSGRSDMHGFVSDDVFKYSSKENYNVIFIGGSVSGQVFGNMGKKIEQDLNALLPVSNAQERKINIFLFSAGAYKEPQPLAVIAYFLAIGAKIDLVINIDGYNELAIAWFNYKDDMDISLPYNWRYRTELLDTQSRLVVSKGLVWSDWKSRWARLMDNPYIRWSPTCTLVWKLGDEWMEHRLERLRAIIAAISMQHSQLGYRNPDNLKGMISRSQQIWFNSNETIASLLGSEHIPYVHLLQPNQYVKNSKILSENENKIAFSRFSTAFNNNPQLVKYASDELNDFVIPNGYDGLRKLGTSADPLEHFIDGTMLFRDVKDDVYIDDCCHVNRLGTEIIWAAILREIKAQSGEFLSQSSIFR